MIWLAFLTWTHVDGNSFFKAKKREIYKQKENYESIIKLPVKTKTDQKKNKQSQFDEEWVGIVYKITVIWMITTNTDRK